MNQKEAFFEAGGAAYMLPYKMPDEEANKWRSEFNACNCHLGCYDNECKYRDKKERFPVDAGGESQCLRLARLKSDFAFRNVNGDVIIIPDSIVERILDKMH